MVIVGQAAKWKKLAANQMRKGGSAAAFRRHAAPPLRDSCWAITPEVAIRLVLFGCRVLAHVRAACLDGFTDGRRVGEFG